MPFLSNVAVLRLALANSCGSGNNFTWRVAGSTRAIAFWPPSVIHGAPSGPTITPCGAAPGPSGISSFLPVLGSNRPRMPFCWPLYPHRPVSGGRDVMRIVAGRQLIKCRLRRKRGGRECTCKRRGHRGDEFHSRLPRQSSRIHPAGRDRSGELGSIKPEYFAGAFLGIEPQKARLRIDRL